MSVIKEFREFAIRGNVVDLAVGIAIGGAFATIAKSLVNDIILPPVGYVLGGVDFSDLFLVIGRGDYPSLAAAQASGAATVNFGLFLNNVIAFVAIAFGVFLFVKLLNRLRREEEQKEKEPAQPTAEQALLTEIRDLLKDRA